MPRTRDPLILVVGGSMGAGHDGVALELARRLGELGCRARTLDFLALLPEPVPRLLRGFYRSMLRRAPWLYELIYLGWFRPDGSTAATTAPLLRLARRRLLREIRRDRPVVVVSTFHLATQALARLRLVGSLDALVVSVTVDPAPHRLWVPAGVDLHLCMHEEQAERVRTMTGDPVLAPGPVVPEAYRSPQRLGDDVQEELGLAAGRPVVLVVAGSWGVGRIEDTVRDLAISPRYQVVVVCGENERLAERLRGLGRGVVLGWRDDVPRLLSAADVVIENAGGLMAMESLAIGTPIVCYRPIPGHGRRNVQALARMGLALYPRTRRGLRLSLSALDGPSPTRDRLVSAGRAAFGEDPASIILDLARTGTGMLMSAA